MSKMRVIRSLPLEGIYHREETVKMGNLPAKTENAVINIFDDVLRQEVVGFGGAFTEAAAYNYAQMDPTTKKAFLEAYFDRKRGIGYNFGRTHIASCDFTLDAYDYVKAGDRTLESFDISRDRKYIIPFLKDAMAYVPEGLTLFASPWSPPAYMKENGKRLGGGRLSEEYMETWAFHYAKYLKAFCEEGIKIAAVSVQNEPNAVQTWESCEYSAEEERDFLEKHLLPALDREGLSEIRVILWDHNKERVFDRAKTVLSSAPVAERTWAVGHHWYSGDHFEGTALVWEELGKPSMCTEICTTMDPGQNEVAIAESYLRELCGDFNHYCAAFCDWNLMLDENGGPFHDRTAQVTLTEGVAADITAGGCYAPILFDSKTKRFRLTPTYYYIGHLSKYVARGARRIGYSKYTDRLQVAAFLNPNGERIVVVENSSELPLPVVIRHEGVCTELPTKPHSVMTLIF